MMQWRGLLSLVKHAELMNLRETEIGRIVRHLSDQTDGFENPKLVLIGGYALRAFTSFSRYTRDCDFVLQKAEKWNLDRLQSTLSTEMFVDTCEKFDAHGFMRCVKLLGDGAKISLDFMEGQVRGRTDEQIFFVSDEFLSNVIKTEIVIANEVFEVYVPNYVDYLLLKLMSARPSDIRDIATLVWKRGLPNNLKEVAKKMLAYPEIIDKNLSVIVSDIADKRFLDSWKGTFVTTEFTETIKENVLKELQKI